MARKTDFERWVEKYQPIFNNVEAEDKSLYIHEHIAFETYGDDMSVINEAQPNTVWTLVEADNNKSYIIPGKKVINRINYFVTTIPFQDEDLKFKY